jgi:hypothetical protein
VTQLPPCHLMDMDLPLPPCSQQGRCGYESDHSSSPQARCEVPHSPWQAQAVLRKARQHWLRRVSPANTQRTRRTQSWRSWSWRGLRMMGSATVRMGVGGRLAQHVLLSGQRRTCRLQRQLRVAQGAVAVVAVGALQGSRHRRLRRHRWKHNGRQQRPSIPWRDRRSTGAIALGAGGANPCSRSS